MGRMRKRFNAKARSGGITNPQPQRSEEEIKIELDIQQDKFDRSNPLVLSTSKKKVPNIEEKTQPTPKILSKKQKKKLQKVLEKKKRKLNRNELLEKLKEVQAKPEELQQLTSTSCMQTYGLKRVVCDSSEKASLKRPMKINTIKGANKKAKLDAKSIPFSSDSEISDSGESEKDILNRDEKDNTKTDLANIEKEQRHSGKVVEGIELEKIDSIETQNSKDDQLQLVSTVKEPEEKMLNLKRTQEVKIVPTVFIPVNRKPEIQADREALPVYCEEQSIIEAINENPVVIIHGETGSGKTTQVPQFLYEAGFTQNNKMIGITEPRRIAAMTMAARVGEELNMPEKVSYHIRYEKTVSKDTEIKFMTDGVLLKELRHDFFLTKYSAIIIDEAHERSVFSDVLIGLLSRIVRIREKRKDPLKLIIMSATIRVEDFTDNPRLFKDPPFLIQITSRQYRVQVHFDLHTPEDYVEAAYNKVCKIHNRLPAGAILVFLTGEKEVQRLCKLLREAFPFKNRTAKCTKENEMSSNLTVPEKISRKKKKSAMEQSDSFCSLPPDINLDDYSVEPLNTEELQHQQSDNEEEDYPNEHIIKKNFENASPLYVLPLYSILPYKEQEKVFKPPPEGSRLCVVATNVAETSITIPGLKYVVDSGKASANQRAGRCGRTEGGHCYRLYSSAVFENEFPDFLLPEIQRIPVDDVLLQMKALGIDRVVEFPFPSPPDKESLKAAEKRLVILGALQNLAKENLYKDLEKWEYSAKVTPLGKAMSRFPLSPRYAKMLLLAYKNKCVQYIAAIVCALTVPDLFLTSSTTMETNDGEEVVKVTKEGIKRIGTGNSAQLGDVMVLLRAVALYENSKNGVKFCIRNGIRHKAMVEIHKMSMQLLKEMNRAFPDAAIVEDMRLSPPDDETVDTIRKIVTCCFIDQIARKIPHDEAKGEKTLKNAYRCLECDELVFIHPSSTQFERLPDYVTYNELSHTSKFYMKGVVEIDVEWLPAFAPDLCHLNAPREDLPPKYDSTKDKIFCYMDGTFGPLDWELPLVHMEMPKGIHRFTWFAYFFLDGQICPAIQSYRKDLFALPSIILKSWARLQPRTRYFLQAIIERDVDSKESLKKAWQKDTKFLLREFWEWLPSSKYFEVELNWPPEML
ncbi:putative ATP-dependent RNA helicase DHX37 like protein [Argiope bruennichi]|uniref:RNA helicase n=1 Tax=Argiope bruennichi TaxID=94029 RepID=A0A8T0FTG4_ARGBR|nr:putative ATP-dependent RNA helicase DHX37 like protein [Argiope bruennichi]